ncbi:MAG: hypothetical protein BYD32DRAFT_304021 [Podila humilis]|nr:MAG: hypothetical protein BYD32DRAFT_304021 [Podila humilis]
MCGGCHWFGGSYWPEFSFTVHFGPIWTFRTGVLFLYICEHTVEIKKKKSLADSRRRYRPVWIYRYEGFWFLHFHHYFSIPSDTFLHHSIHNSRTTTWHPRKEHSHGERRIGNVIVYLFVCLFVCAIIARTSERKLISVLITRSFLCLFVCIAFPYFCWGPAAAAVALFGQERQRDMKEKQLFVWLDRNDGVVFVHPSAPCFPQPRCTKHTHTHTNRSSKIKNDFHSRNNNRFVDL